MPSCFISYSWDSDEHQRWVRGLAGQLRLHGIDAHFDQFELKAGSDLTAYMEQMVRGCDYVILVCTPNYADRADRGVGGVGYEKTIVTGEIYTGRARPHKFVPLLRAGNAKLALPSYLSTKLFIDFREDAAFAPKLEELLRLLHGKPAFTAPSLGDAPNFAPPEGHERIELPHRGDESVWSELAIFFEPFDVVGSDAEVTNRYGDVWTIGESRGWCGEVSNGFYRLSNASDPTGVHFIYLRVVNDDTGPIDLSDSPVSVEVRTANEESPMSCAGLIYRFDGSDYIAFAVRHDGYSVWRRDANGVSKLVGESSPVIRTEGFNKLGIVGRGPKLDLYINDVRIRSVSDTGLSKGDPGIVAIGMGQFDFDNVAIYGRPPS